MSNSIKGLTVEINGNVQPLTNAINQLDNPLKSSKNELKQIDKLLKLDPHNTELLAQRQQVLAQAISQAKSKLDTLKTAEQQAQQQFARGEIGEEQMRALSRAVIAAENDLKKLENQGKDAGKEVKEGGEEGKKGLEKTADAASKAENKLQGLKAAGKIVGSTIAAGFTAAAAAGFKLVKDLAGMTTDAADYADTILTEAKVTGMSTEQLQAYHYAAEQLDTSLETVTRSQTKNLKSMQSAAKGTGDAFDAYTRLGISVADADGRLRDANTVYWEAIDALGKIEDETERDALGMTLFGKSAKELNPLIEAGSARLAELTEEAHSMGAVLSEETLQELGHLDDSMQQLKSGGTALKNQLGTVLRPEMQGFVDDLNGLLGEMSTGIEQADGDWDKISAILSDGADRAAAILANFVPKVLETVGDGVLAVAGALIDKTPELFTAAEKMAGKLQELAPRFIEAGVGLIRSVIKGVGNNAGKLVAVGKDAALDLIKGVAQLAPDAAKAAGQLVSEMIKAIPEMVPQIVEVSEELAYGLIDGLMEASGEISTAVVKLFIPFETAAEKAAQKAQEAAASVTPFAEAIKNAVSTTDPEKLLDAYGRTSGEIEKIIGDKEQAIHDILAERLAAQQSLRDEDLENIRAYLREIEELENSKLGIYQGQQQAAKKKTELDTDMGQEEGAQHLAESAAALDNTLAAIDDVYADRLTQIENLHNAGAKGYRSDAEYNYQLEAAKAWYDEQVAAAQDIRRDTAGIVQERSRAWAEDSAAGFAKIADDFSLWVGDELKNRVTGLMWTEFAGLETTKGSEVNEYVSRLAGLDLDAANTFLTTTAIRAQNGEALDEETKAIVADILSAFEGFDDDFDEAARGMLDSMISGLQQYLPGLKNAGSMTTDEIVDVISKALNGEEPGGQTEEQKTGFLPGYGSPRDYIASLIEQMQQDAGEETRASIDETTEATKIGNQTLAEILTAVHGLNLTLVLDDGTVIARTIGGIDGALGDRARSDKRGSFE